VCGVSLPIFKVSFEAPGKNISIVATNMAITTDLGDCNNSCISVLVKDNDKDKTIAVKELIPSETIKHILTLISTFLTRLKLPLEMFGDLVGAIDSNNEKYEEDDTLSFINILKSMDFKLSNDAEAYLNDLPEEANLIMSAMLFYVLVLNIRF
jgi:hypothetical protein